jgi:hypothetical protein
MAELGKGVGFITGVLFGQMDVWLRVGMVVPAAQRANSV